MKLYFINHDGTNKSHYGTLAEAKKDAKEAAKTSPYDVSVELVHIATDKANILRLLNADSGTQTAIEIVYTAKAGVKR